MEYQLKYFETNSQTSLIWKHMDKFVWFLMRKLFSNNLKTILNNCIMNIFKLRSLVVETQTYIKVESKDTKLKLP